eukprot:6227927-Amphidinium_carterae.1
MMTMTLQPAKSKTVMERRDSAFDSTTEMVRLCIAMHCERVDGGHGRRNGSIESPFVFCTERQKGTDINFFR